MFIRKLMCSTCLPVWLCPLEIVENNINIIKRVNGKVVEDAKHNPRP
jgi:hypothetical protein